jgi:hypothetical protein
LDGSRFRLAGSFPGPEASALFGYYDGGTPWDPNDPSTMLDDCVLAAVLRDGGAGKLVS